MAKPAPPNPVADLRRKYNAARREGVPVRLSHAHAAALLRLLEGFRENPSLVVLGNPPAGRMSSEVLAIEYIHADDGEAYRHDFTENGVTMDALDGGGILISHPELRLWEDF